MGVDEVGKFMGKAAISMSKTGWVENGKGEQTTADTASVVLPLHAPCERKVMEQ